MVSPLVEGRKDRSHTKMAFACRGSDFDFSTVHAPPKKPGELA